ncbi:hypothetical protein IW261DRAFT_1490043 [Armillaria novae-zelandiae]|uniref:Uncharacterized protein n=1 Tax=Armillaria novae-zelandiae TaxID=153914 RepID=A0AA39P3A2_9AGAR|nr:hypothetical protein IW261DRAFT_1490043 [Armillaria novae-zelandiae]
MREDLRCCLGCICPSDGRSRQRRHGDTCHARGDSFGAGVLTSLDPPYRPASGVCQDSCTWYAGPHIAAPRSVTGRATLGLPVYDIQTKTVMFLKDSWRGSNLPQEAKIL